MFQTFNQANMKPSRIQIAIQSVDVGWVSCLLPTEAFAPPVDHQKLDQLIEGLGRGSSEAPDGIFIKTGSNVKLSNNHQWIVNG